MNQVAPNPEEGVVLTKAILRVAEALGLSQRELARILGVSEATVSRLMTSTFISPSKKEGELALLLVRIFRGLDALVGGDERKVQAWFHSPNAHLGGIPAERVLTVEGLVDVATYLDAMRGHV
ncbi:DUF2384 domain-containing protein [Pendulispora brunnea]|uniref:DUF2384 domain-containing protein n=1 Tax=Pendulispora brunnea TaxID=2905690 RepID=A0ABZ2K1V1_9BACT